MRFLRLTSHDGNKYMIDISDIKLVDFDVDDESTCLRVYSSDTIHYCRESLEEIVAALSSFESILVEVRSAQ